MELAEDSASQLEVLMAEHAMRQALYRYCRGADRADAESMMSAFHPDAIDNHGGYQGLAAHYVRQYVEGIQTINRMVMHTISNLLVSLRDRDHASSEAYFVSYLVPIPSGGVEGVVDCFGGRYLDEWERRDGIWAIRERTVVHDWHSTGQPSSRTFPRDLSGYVNGQWKPGDVSYEHLKTKR
jgi:hypothetical protein